MSHPRGLPENVIYWLDAHPAGGSAQEISNGIGVKSSTIGTTVLRLVNQGELDRFEYGGIRGGFVYVIAGDRWFKSEKAQEYIARVTAALYKLAPVWVKEKQLARVSQVSRRTLQLVLARMLDRGDVKLRMVDKLKSGRSRKSYRWGLGWEAWALRASAKAEAETVCV